MKPPGQPHNTRSIPRIDFLLKQFDWPTVIASDGQTTDEKTPLLFARQIEGKRSSSLYRRHYPTPIAVEKTLPVHLRKQRVNARLTFNRVVNDCIQDMVDVSSKFSKLLNDDPAFAGFFHDLMFNRYLQMSQTQLGA